MSLNKPAFYPQFYWETAQIFLKIQKIYSLIRGQSISYHYKAGENIVFHLKVTLAYKKQLVKTNPSRRNYTTLYANLTPNQAKKLKNLAKKRRNAESEVLRQILDAYLKDIENKGLPHEPFRKLCFTGYKVLPRTIRKDQDRRLREIAEETGRKITELVREAVEKLSVFISG